MILLSDLIFRDCPVLSYTRTGATCTKCQLYGRSQATYSAVIRGTEFTTDNFCQNARLCKSVREGCYGRSQVCRAGGPGSKFCCLISKPNGPRLISRACQGTARGRSPFAIGSPFRRQDIQNCFCQSCRRRNYWA